jgi:hypothetical protein
MMVHISTFNVKKERVAYRPENPFVMLHQYNNESGGLTLCQHGWILNAFIRSGVSHIQDFGNYRCPVIAGELKGVASLPKERSNSEDEWETQNLQEIRNYKCKTEATFDDFRLFWIQDRFGMHGSAQRRKHPDPKNRKSTIFRIPDGKFFERDLDRPKGPPSVASGNTRKILKPQPSPSCKWP